VWESVTSQEVTASHHKCGKVVYRPCSSYYTENNGNSIEFSLSTQTWRVIKLSQAKSLYADISFK